MRFCTWIANGFRWLGDTLGNPADEQGSTKRLCLFLFLGTFMFLWIMVTGANGWKWQDIPTNICTFVFTIAAGLGLAIGYDRKVEADKAIQTKAVCDEKGADNVQSTDTTDKQQN